MHTRVSEATRLQVDLASAPKRSFGTWTGRAAVVLVAAGLVSFNVLAAGTGEMTAATAWGYIGAVLATMLGVVAGVASVSSGMNHH
ncbi:MAG TPA: hypothetical protein VFZ93_05615 [Albitalea sp.]